MRTREVTVPWNEMLEGDKFLRFEQRDPSDKVIVQRPEPDLPTEMGSMGYATIIVRGRSMPGMLVIKARKGGTSHLTWMAPLVDDVSHRWVHESKISEFEEVRTASKVGTDAVRQAVIDASGKSHSQLEFVGVDVDAITFAVIDLFYDGD